MKRAVQIGTGLLAAILLVWGVRAWVPSEERQIQRQLDALAEAASFEAGEPNLVRMANAARIGGYFTEDATIDLGPPLTAIHGREAIRAIAARVQVPAEGVEIDFVDIQIAVASEGTRATVSMTVTGSGLDLATGDRVIDARELDVRLRKVENEWLIWKVEAVSAIERPE